MPSLSPHCSSPVQACLDIGNALFLCSQSAHLYEFRSCVPSLDLLALLALLPAPL